MITFEFVDYMYYGMLLWTFFCGNVTYTVLTQVITIIIERLITHAHITVTGEAWLQA